MQDRNAAYDLTLFDEKAAKKSIIRLNTKKLKRIRILKAKLALLLSTAAVCGTASLAVTAFISGQARLTELIAEETKLEKKFQENESLYIQLDMKKKSELLDENFRERLKKDFKMMENKNPEYINIMNTDSGEIKEDPTDLSNIRNKIFELCNNLFAF